MICVYDPPIRLIKLFLNLLLYVELDECKFAGARVDEIVKSGRGELRTVLTQSTEWFAFIRETIKRVSMVCIYKAHCENRTVYIKEIRYMSAPVHVYFSVGSPSWLISCHSSSMLELTKVNIHSPSSRNSRWYPWWYLFWVRSWRVARVKLYSPMWDIDYPHSMSSDRFDSIDDRWVGWLGTVRRRL